MRPPSTFRSLSSWVGGLLGRTEAGKGQPGKGEPYYFPNQPPEAMNIEARFRAEVKPLPEHSLLVLYELLSGLQPTFVPTTFRVEDRFIIARQEDVEIVFPRPIPLIKLSHLMHGYRELLWRKYTLPGFLAVEPGDIVVDCGAYVGGFSFYASRIAGHIHAFEPAPANCECVARNLAHAGNVTVNNLGLYSETKTMALNMSASSVEHSFLTPDDGPAIDVREVQAVTLADYCRSAGVKTVDFVKIEAEGVELEVFAGVGTPPRKLAIDVSPERNGESPADEFRKLLTEAGYEVTQRINVMFAKRAR